MKDAVFDFSRALWLGAELGIPPPAMLASRGRAALGEVLVLPGLINSHDHLAFNNYPPTGTPPYPDFVAWSRDVQGRRDLLASVEAIPYATRRQLGVLKNLLWGVTSVADHGGTAGEDAIAVLAPYPTLHSPELEPWGAVRLLYGRAPVVMHMAEGTTAESRARALSFLRRNLTRRAIAAVHGVGFANDDYRRLAALIWCPASNLFLLGRTADVAAAARHVPILIGTDSTLSAPGTLWDHLRLARGRLPDRNILAALTTAAAAFWRLPPERLQEDFFVVRRRAADPWDAFFAIAPADILLVVRRSRIVLADEMLAPHLAIAPLSPVVCGATRKFVAMPPQPGMDAIADRFTGATEGGCRAA